MNPEFLREAIRLSREGMRAGQGGPFGAVVVKDDRVIGRGWNKVLGANDPTAHAEVVAIREACRGLQTFRLENCEIYASCEPCPMCLGAIYWARCAKIYFAAGRSDAAAAGFDDDFFYRELALPSAVRRVSAGQFLREEALPALAEWQRRTDKVIY